MAFLNKQQRDSLLNDIKNKSFQQIRGYINRKDKQARLAYYRNVQESGKWMTRYVLESLGTQVTLYEAIEKQTQSGKTRRKYTIEQIVVEPTTGNST